MNHVERFRAVMNFQPVDRLPRIEWANWWDKTVDRWKTEGLPSELKTVFEISEYFGLDPYFQHWVTTNELDELEPGDEKAQGAVRNMDDYIKLRPKIFPDHDFEYLGTWQKKQEDGDVVIWITLEGFFWHPRTLLGVEGQLYGFYDMPEVIHQINKDLAEYHIRMIRKIADYCRPTFMTFAEDMSYNHGPMLSKEHFNEFLTPYYKQVVPVIEEYDIFPMVDTDGQVGPLVPGLLEAGIKGILPLERQAGVDAAQLRKKYSTLRMIGHFNKLVMNKGEQAIREEFERLLPVMKTGGFIPSVDHQTPPGVSLEQYKIYLKLLNEYTANCFD